MSEERYITERLGVWPEELAAALVDELMGLIRQLYAIHPTGGPLHVQLDDGNIDGEIKPRYDGFTDADLDALYVDGWPIAELPPEAPAVIECMGRSTRQLCDEIAAKLNAMDEESREVLLARHHGWLTR